MVVLESNGDLGIVIRGEPLSLIIWHLANDDRIRLCANLRLERDYMSCLDEDGELRQKRIGYERSPMGTVLASIEDEKVVPRDDQEYREYVQEIAVITRELLKSDLSPDLGRLPGGVAQRVVEVLERARRLVERISVEHRETDLS